MQCGPGLDAAPALDLRSKRPACAAPIPGRMRGALTSSTLLLSIDEAERGGHMEADASEGFFERVYGMVEQVPRGMVATYGQIAKLIGEPRRARYVGNLKKGTGTKLRATASDRYAGEGLK